MTTTKFRRYDATRFLNSDDDVVGYLNAAFEDGHPAVIAKAIGNVARARGMSQISQACGLGRESLYKSLSENGNPELATILKVLKALNIHIRVEPDAGTLQNTPRGGT